MNFTDLLSKEAREELEKAIRQEKTMAESIAALSNKDLKANTEYWMANCDQPKRFPKGEPVYDSTFWHIIVPELLKRLDKNE